jgi:Protein of unknown function (DUF3105)
MSSRQEEKQRRREERLAQEHAAAAGAARMRRIQMVVGGLLVVAVIAGIVIAITSSGGSGNGPQAAPTREAAIPPLKDGNLTSAAKAAGCKVLNPPSEGRGHVTSTVTYKTNPPSSGSHNPIPAQDGVYDPGNTPAKENYVHSLEHGRIEIQYRPGTSRHRIDQLTALFNEKVNGAPGYHTLVFENNTKMPYEVAATAWTHILACPTFNDGVFDAIRDFRTRYTDQGPETVP